MTPIQQIESLATSVAKRHNSFLLRRISLIAIAITASLIIISSLFWVTRGHSVPIYIPVSLTTIALLSSIAAFITKRMDIASAVIAADEHFKLKDGITTARHLASSAPESPHTSLQWNWLSPQLLTCNPKSISLPLSPKLSSASAITLITATILCLLPPSDSVRAAQQLAQQTRQRVTESKKELEKLIEELDKEITESDEKEALDMDEFRKMINEIDETGDHTEAARQFARIERKVREATRDLDQQRDEETLKLAAKELQKSEDTDARKLGKKLDEKELKEAAELLEKLASKKFDPKDLKKSPQQKQQTLDDAKKELAKLRAASKRLAAAGKQRQAANQAQGNPSDANAKGAEGAQGDGQQHPQGEPLEDMLAELDDAAAEMEENLEEMEFDPDAEWDDENQENLECMECAKGKLSKHLKKMNGKRLAKSKLDALRQALAQAQAQCNGQSQQYSLANLGGKAPGTGSSWNERKETDDSQKNGSLTQLQGQHGDGPSLSAVEDSDSGTGTSTRKGTTAERDFSRQVESFVQRDDIPESLKLGLRNYFENLQSAKPE